MRRLLASVLSLAVITAFASTFILPATCETQRLLWRMLLRLPRENTSFMTASPSWIVPWVRISDSFRDRLASNQPGTPDCYVVGRCIRARLNHFPSPELWQDHPLARWAAMDAVVNVWSLKPAASAGTPLAAVRLQPSEPVSNILATIRQAQFEYPTEGGLWLAEAVVLFELGDDSGGYNCAWNAINRNDWTKSMDRFPEHASLLLQQEGLPRLEADRIAFQAIWDEPHSQLSHRVCDFLVQMAARAIHAGAYDAADECLIAFLSLGGVARESLGSTVEIEHNAGFAELVNAMAARSGAMVPSRRDSNDLEAVSALEKRAFADYLDRLSVPGLHRLALLEAERNRETCAARCWQCEAMAARAGQDPLLPGLPGSFAALLGILLVCGLVAEVPFLLAPPVRLGSREIFPAGFLPLLLFVMAALAAAAFPSLQSVLGADDLCWKGGVVLPGCYLTGVFTFCIVMVTTGLRRVLVWHPGWYRLVWLGVFALHLLAVCRAAEARAAALEGLAASFIGIKQA